MTDTPATQYARLTDGERVAFQVVGSGSLDVVVLHGATIPIDLLWDDPGLVRFRDRLSLFSRNIWLEFVGWGASERDLSPYRVSNQVEQIEAVLDAAGCSRVALLGLGPGGLSAIRYAAARPERVTAMALFEAYASYIRDHECRWGIPRRLLELLTDGVRDTWGTGATVQVTAPSKAGDDRFREWFGRCERLASSPDYAVERIRARLSDDVRPLLPLVHAPTLVLHRCDDQFVRVDAGRYLAAQIAGAKYVELPGEDNLFFVGDVDAILDEVQDHLTGTRSSPEGDVVLSTVLFTDIVDSTQRAAAVGRAAWSRMMAEHDAVVRAALRRYRGREIKTLGDGFLVTFDGAARAIRCAEEIRHAALGIGLEVRAGIHIGEVEFRDNDVTGLAVTISKRVCDLASPGQILVTETARGSIVGSNIDFDDQGAYDLKGIPGRWNLASLRL
jgi:class 3 adenylate cyclase